MSRLTSAQAHAGQRNPAVDIHGAGKTADSLRQNGER